MRTMNNYWNDEGESIKILYAKGFIYLSPIVEWNSNVTYLWSIERGNCKLGNKIINATTNIFSDACRRWQVLRLKESRYRMFNCLFQLTVSLLDRHSSCYTTCLSVIYNVTHPSIKKVFFPSFLLFSVIKDSF